MTEMPDMPTPVEAPVLPDIEFVVAEDAEAELNPPYHVIMHNDDVTTFAFVISVLKTIYEKSHWDAVAITYRVHYTGQAIAITTDLEDAKYRVMLTRQRALANNFPFRLSIEKA